jgi:hypothetical protein
MGPNPSTLEPIKPEVAMHRIKMAAIEESTKARLKFLANYCQWIVEVGWRGV